MFSLSMAATASTESVRVVTKAYARFISLFGSSTRKFTTTSPPPTSSTSSVEIRISVVFQCTRPLWSCGLICATCCGDIGHFILRWNDTRNDICTDVTGWGKDCSGTWKYSFRVGRNADLPSYHRKLTAGVASVLKVPFPEGPRAGEEISDKVMECPATSSVGHAHVGRG